MKYEMTDQSIIIQGIKLYRIKALKGFCNVKKGDLGGFIQGEQNLSQYSNAWIDDEAKVFGNARVFGNAKVFGNARVFGNAVVYNNAEVFDESRVYENAEVFDEARVLHNARISGFANITSKNEWMTFTNVGSENETLNAFKSLQNIEVDQGLFVGTLEEFEEKVEETHGNNENGKLYKVLIEAIKLRFGER